MSAARAAGTPLHWLLGSTAGLGLWASSFVWLYGGLALGCTWGWQTQRLAGSNALTLALLGLWLLHLLALALLWRWWGRWPAGSALRRLARLLTAIALACTVWTGWPTLLLPPCAGQELALTTSETAPCSKT